MLKYVIHAVETFFVCLGREILFPQTSRLLNLKTLERDIQGAPTLFQTHETPFQEWSVYQATAQTVNMNLDYNYKFFTADERRNFIEHHFGAQSLQVRAYDTVINGAIKADLFRICVLYIFGGVYLDCKGATIHPFRSFVPADSNFTMFIETWDSRLGNSFIASTPRNPLMSAIMAEALFRVLNKRHGENPLDVTGPEMFGAVVRHFLGIKQLKKGRYRAGGVIIDLVGTINFFNSFMCVAHNLPVIKRQPDTYFFSLRKLLFRYELSWIAGKFFK